MELYSVNLKAYKKFYAGAIIVSLVAVLACWAAVAAGYTILPFFFQSYNIVRAILVLLVAGAIFNSWYYRKRINQLDNYTDFEDKLPQHEKIYKMRLLWLVVSCAASAFLYLLTARNLFLYFAVFDFFVCLTAFPNKMLIQKELKNDEIIFV